MTLLSQFSKDTDALAARHSIKYAAWDNASEVNVKQEPDQGDVVKQKPRESHTDPAPMAT